MKCALGFLPRSVGLLLAIALYSLSVGQAFAAQEDYNYPKITSREVYKAKSLTLADADRRVRLGYLQNLERARAALPYPQRVAIFAKGEEAQKLIIVALDDEIFRTLFRARATLARLTYMARLTPVVQEHAVEDIFNFFDFSKLLGFTTITVSDGVSFAHQIELK